MAKQKTKKAASKRFKFSSKGKVRRRAVRQAHFNARETGNQTRNKHRDRGISQTDEGRIQDLIPHS